MAAVKLVQRSILPAIQRAVRRVEKRITPPEYQMDGEWFGEIIFPTTGPRNPWYQGTPIEDLSDYLADLNLPSGLKFADLGSGLGSACFAAAAHFERVTGFEQNPEFMAEAEGLREEFGVTNVEFRNEDFMEQPLEEFNIIYFFKPFTEDFFEKIMEKLMTVPPGMLIISRRYLRELFNPTGFDYLDPQNRQALLPRTTIYFPPSGFYTFVRK